MKRIIMVFYMALLILALLLPVFSYADTVGTLPVPEGFSVRIESSYVLINMNGAGTNEYISLERSTDSGPFHVIATLGPGYTSYKDFSVTNGHVYKYRARRLGSKPASAYTEELEVIYLRATDFRITGVYSNQINLEWSYPELMIPRTVPYETIIERRAEGESRWTVICTAPFYQREFRDHGLNPDTMYYYRVYTRYSDSQYSTYIPSATGINRRTTISLTTPLTGFALSDIRIRLDWDREALDGHTVYLQRLSDFGEYNIIFYSSSADHYVDTGLTPGREYTYRLFVSTASGSFSGYSEEVVIKTEAIPAPAQLTASPAALGSITLSWEYPYDGESGFEIWRKEQGGIWQKIATASRNTTVWTDHSALAGVTYRYRVRAIRGEEVFSDFAVSGLVINTDPSMPSDLLIVPMGSYMLIGSSEPAPAGVTYTLELRTNINEGWVDYSLGETGRTLLVYFIPTAGRDYEFRIRSENQGNITYGPVYYLPGSVPEAPTGLRVVSMGSNRVRLAWNDLSRTEDGFRIYRVIGDKRTLIGTAPRDAAGFTDSGAVSGSTSSYVVCPYNIMGESAGTSIRVSIPQKAVFKDLAGYSWCEEAVSALAASGVIDQNAEGLFRPGANITMAEFITILLKSFDIAPESEFLFSVKDVAPRDWHYPYMMTAVKLGIVIPDQNGYVRPLNTVTKADMAVCMNRLLASRNQALDSISTSYLDRFTDGYQVQSGLRSIISSLAGDGIMPPQGGTSLDLDKPATRAEAAVILHRFSRKYYKAG